MALFLTQVFAAALLLDVTAADVASARVWDVADYRSLRTPSNRTMSNRAMRGVVKPRQSLQPTPGEIRGLGSRWPDIGVAPGTAGAPTYFPRAMRPIEPE
jgi:hypothetical protein